MKIYLFICLPLIIILSLLTASWLTNKEMKKMCNGIKGTFHFTWTGGICNFYQFTEEDYKKIGVEWKCVNFKEDNRSTAVCTFYPPVSHYMNLDKGINEIKVDKWEDIRISRNKILTIDKKGNLIVIDKFQE